MLDRLRPKNVLYQEEKYNDDDLRYIAIILCLYAGEGEEVESSRVREGSGEEIEEIEMEVMVRELRKMKNGKAQECVGSKWSC